MTALTDFLAPGIILPYALPTAPVGWLLCDGSALGVDTPHQALRGLLLDAASPYGTSGDDPRLPDLRGRLPLGAGAGAGLTARTLGDTGGAEVLTLTEGMLPSHTHGSGTLAANPAGSHTHTQGSLTTNSTGSHTHSSGTLATASAGAHTHTVDFSNSDTGSGYRTTISDTNSGPITTSSSGSHTHAISGSTGSSGAHSHSVSGEVDADGAHTHTVSGSTGSTGSGDDAPVVNPFVVLQYIIKT